MKRLEARCSIAAFGLLLGCGRTDAKVVSAQPSVTAVPSATDSSKATGQRDEGLSAISTGGPPFTVGTVEQRSDAGGATLLTDVRSARHAGFDRIVFEFAASARPGYHVEYIDRPVRKCGSGAVTPIAGDGWLEVRFEPADAHTPSGAPTIAKREQRLDLGVVKELEQTCDFEAHVTWVVGVSRPNQYRVIVLQKPERVVVDIKH